VPKLLYLVVTGIPSPGDMTPAFFDLLDFINNVGTDQCSFSRMNKSLYEKHHEAMIIFKDQNDYVRFKLRFSDDFAIRTAHC